jgi:hypothetical protein
MILARCYNATVNESETITDAQPFCPVRYCGEAGNPRSLGFRLPAAPHIERS